MDIGVVIRFDDDVVVAADELEGGVDRADFFTVCGAGGERERGQRNRRQKGLAEEGAHGFSDSLLGAGWAYLASAQRLVR